MTSSSFFKGQELNLTVESLSSQGKAVAKLEGMVFFIEAGCPGDQLKVKITKLKKRFAEAEILEVITPSERRTTPPCPVFDSCGGCSWQHVDYSEQIVQKKKIITDAITRVAKTQAPPHFEVIQSKKEYRYRNRIQVHHKNGKAGYFAKGSHQLIDIEDCLIADESLIPSLKKMKSQKENGRVEIRLINQEVKILSSEKDLGFAQVNESQNEKMIHLVQEWIAEYSPKKLIDLYCGQGNFTLPLAKSLPDCEFIGVDLNKNAIRNANEKAHTLALKNIQFDASDSGDFLKQSPIQPSFAPTNDKMLLIDPTRDGCDEELVNLIDRSDFSALLYISCNPATWARDVALLGEHWKVSKLSGFDLFPQTPHVEVVSLLERN